MPQGLGAEFGERFVALVGSPNSGKTTLFNWLTGSRFKTVNYPGATVDYSIGTTHARWGEPVAVMDTPGTYSLHPKSPDERVAFEAIFRHPRRGPASAVVSVVDAVHLSRHLLVTQQLLASGFRVVVALTMSDLVRERGDEIDAAHLSRKLGCPVVEIDGRLGGGVAELAREMRALLASAAAGDERPVAPRPERLAAWSERETESALRRAQALADSSVRKSLSSRRSDAQDARLRTAAIDRVLLHPFWGVVAFFGIMGTLFSSIFWAAAPLMDAVDKAFSSLGAWTLALDPGALWTHFLANGAVASLGAVLTFAPQIFILFFGISLLEDSGYLARSAALADRPFSSVGLNGRSFVPLLSGYACAVPAMMAARTMGSRRERLLTLFVIPLMSCSARLPVYALLLGFLFRGGESWKGGAALAAIYFASLLVGAAAAAVAGRFLPEKEPSFFMLELPLYRRPSLLHAARSALSRTRHYVKKAGPPIFAFALLIWSATTFPRYDLENPRERLEASYAGRAGQALQPIFAPMGADWRVGVGLMSAFAARETFVASLATVFQVADGGDDGGDDDSMRATLLGKMEEARAPDGRPLFTLASVVGLIAFFMIALQCISTVAIAAREAGGWRFALVQLAVFNVLAYVVAVGLVQGLRLIGVA